MTRGLLLLALLLTVPGLARGSDWGAIEPGVTSLEQVRDRYGSPSRETQPKVDGYDTVQWIYEGDKAPPGLVRMTVDFGLLLPGGYRPFRVRLLKLEPKPLIFGRQTVIQGWGLPDSAGKHEGLLTFFYKDGLFVVFDKEGESAASMIFSPPQPDVPGTSGSPPAPPPEPAKR